MRSLQTPFIALAVLAVLLLSAGASQAFLGFGGSHQTVKLQNGTASTPLSALADGKARYFQAEVNGGTVRFFLVKDQAGGVRAAFDACDVCWREHKGYTQDGAYMVCNNCGQAFPIARIGAVQGGCNPSPLAFSVDAKAVTIKAPDLAAGLRYFQG
ncbi:MAG: DUF2318 domain-containing protein [Thermodesulfobacteriota bacterium]